ncbi:hypothetical protein GCM10023092_09180 [Rurimicrobium arvi]|uniref:Uncharacterized protein n=1 Tax=Rurimicrobium arvi TaxID=2049916 RepID=A0ABP8MN37_9BACT
MFELRSHAMFLLRYALTRGVRYIVLLSQYVKELKYYTNYSINCDGKGVEPLAPPVGSSVFNL